MTQICKERRAWHVEYLGRWRAGENVPDPPHADKFVRKDWLWRGGLITTRVSASVCAARTAAFGDASLLQWRQERASQMRADWEAWRDKHGTEWAKGRAVPPPPHYDTVGAGMARAER